MTQTPFPPERRVGFAVVGVGELTEQELLPAFGLSARARLAAIVTGDKAEVMDLARGYGLADGDVYSYDEFENLQERPDVHAVYLVTPNSLHREYTERAAAIGKHVLTEKPMSTNVEDAEAMVRACEDAGVKLMVAYRCQYTPHHWAARDLVQSGALGRIRLLESLNGQMETSPDPWRMKRALAGGGPLPDVGLYSVNTARFVLGVEPVEVFAFLHRPEGDPRFDEVEESVAWMMRFPDGTVANCATSYNTAQTRTLRAVGEKGSFAMDPAFDYQNLKLSVRTGDGVTEKSVEEPDQFTLELDHFARCIQEDLRPFTPGEEGVQDQRILAAIYESAAIGKPVRLPPVEGRDVFRGDPPEGHDRA